MKLFNTIRLLVFAVLAGAIVLPASAPGVLAGDGDSGSETDFLSNVRRLTFEGRRAGEGYFSPDGDYLIFQSEREPGNPFFQIYILSFLDGETHRVSPGTGKTTCAFFRAGTDEVLFGSTHLDPDAVKKQKEEIAFRESGKKKRHAWDYDEQYDIFSTKRDGSDMKRLTDVYGYDAEAAYSPDGKYIVFCSMRDVYTEKNLSEKDRELLERDISYFGEIYIMNADGSEQKRLTDWPGYDGGPFFTADGERIIWRHFDESGRLAEIYTMRIDGSDRRQLTDFGALSWAPYMHPSGEYAIFTTNKHGFDNFELYIVDAAGTKEPVRVSYTAGFDGLPVFSPDGKVLAWTSNRTDEGTSHIYIGDWDHNAALAALRDACGRQARQKGAGGDPSKNAPYLDPDETSGNHAGSGESSSQELSKKASLYKISTASLRKNVEYLASDKLEGRLAGSKGARIAGDFVARRFVSVGLEPLGDGETYFQEFPLTHSAPGESSTGRNVIGFIPAPETAGQKRYILIGAHYDHFGRGEAGQIHNGADDNASGTSVMMELAAAIKSEYTANPGKYNFGVIFAGWSAKEPDMTGSVYFAQHPPVPLDEIAAYFNFDTVGKLRDNTLVLHGTGSSTAWKKIIEKKNVVAGFNLDIHAGAGVPTDASSFYAKQIPVVNFSTGPHEGYRRLGDKSETLDYEGMARVAKFARMVITATLKNTAAPDYVDVTSAASQHPGRGSGVYLGTVPDFSGDAEEGFQISGVREGSPAEAGGLLGGDIIVKFAGKPIKDIHDFSDALDAAKIGEAVEIVVIRAGEQITLTVTPDTRK